MGGNVNTWWACQPGNSSKYGKGGDRSTSNGCRLNYFNNKNECFYSSGGGASYEDGAYGGDQGNGGTDAGIGGGGSLAAGCGHGGVSGSGMVRILAIGITYNE